MRNFKLLITTFVLIIIAFSLTACVDKEQNDKKLTTGLKATEINNEAFKKLFPLQYTSYMKNMEMKDTTYGGSEPRSKFSDDKEPLLPILFNGYAFATDYNRDGKYHLATITGKKKFSHRDVLRFCDEALQ